MEQMFLTSQIKKFIQDTINYEVFHQEASVKTIKMIKKFIVRTFHYQVT